MTCSRGTSFLARATVTAIVTAHGHVTSTASFAALVSVIQVSLLLTQTAAMKTDNAHETLYTRAVPFAAIQWELFPIGIKLIWLLLLPHT